MNWLPQEQQILTRKKARKDEHTLALSMALAQIALTLVILAAAANIFVEPNVAVAKTVEPVYQNDWYCAKLQTTYAGRVVGGGDIKSLCAKWGVEI